MNRRVPARPADTHPEAERVQAGLFRAVSIAGRIRRALGLSTTVIGAARRGIARAHPGASPWELDLRFVELHYGRGLAAEMRGTLERRDGMPPVR
jgi:hypothetical protein